MLALLASAFAQAGSTPPGGQGPSSTPSSEDVLAEARRHSTRGAVLVTTGIAAMGGGVATLVVRPGGPGEKVPKGTDTSLNGLRSVGGAVLLMGGFSVLYAGGNELGTARGLRDRVAVLPAPGGLVVSGRF